MMLGILYFIVLVLAVLLIGCIVEIRDLNESSRIASKTFETQIEKANYSRAILIKKNVNLEELHNINSEKLKGLEELYNINAEKLNSLQKTYDDCLIQLNEIRDYMRREHKNYPEGEEQHD